MKRVILLGMLFLQFNFVFSITDPLIDFLVRDATGKDDVRSAVKKAVVSGKKKDAFRRGSKDKKK